MFYIPFTYNGHTIKVGNIQERTTCAQIVAAAKSHSAKMRHGSRRKETRQGHHLAERHREEAGGAGQEECGVFEAYGGIERLLPPHTPILGVWQSWKKQTEDVTLTIKPLPALVIQRRHLVSNDEKMQTGSYWQTNEVKSKKRNQCRVNRECVTALADRRWSTHIYSITANKLTRIVHQQMRQLQSQGKRLTTLDLHIESACLTQAPPSVTDCWDNCSDDDALSHSYWFDDVLHTAKSTIDNNNSNEKDCLELFERIVQLLDALIEHEEQINMLLVLSNNVIVAGNK